MAQRSRLSFSTTVRCFALSISAVLFSSFLAVPPVAAQGEVPDIAAVPEIRNGGDPGAGAPADRFIVKFKEESSSGVKRGKAYGKVSRALGISVQELRSNDQGLSVLAAESDLSSGRAEQVADTLHSLPEVEYAEIDVFLRPTATPPNDSYYSLQWDLFEDKAGIRAPGAWERSTGEGQTVAVIDSGITNHSDLAGQTVPGYDFITDPMIARDGSGRDANAQDEGDWCGTGTSSWHGTHVAGTIAAATNNGKGVAGVAYDAQIQPVRALGSCGGYTSDIIDAITWAVGGTVDQVPANPAPADVVNLSLGGTAPCSTSLQNTLSFAASMGAVVVAAAGNDNHLVANTSPANCNEVITIGATGRDGARAPYSNYGPNVDISAPGGNMGVQRANGIASTWNSGSTTPGADAYAYLQGTSMAAPHVAGVAALMLAANPDLTPEQIETELKDTARPLPGPCDTGGCGTGLLDATAAVAAATASTTAPLPPVMRELTSDTPTIAGTPAVGVTLTADEGEWVPTPVTFTYQWLRDGEPIVRAVNRTYTATIDDEGHHIAVTVSGSKPDYEPTSATSPAVTIRPFIDVAPDRIFASEIRWLAINGISNGWTEADGTRTYRPLQAVNRDAMAAFMYRLEGRPDYTPPRTSPFTDVPTNHLFYKEIAWLATTGVSNGWTEADGTRTYRPFEAVNRDAMAAFMYRLAGKPEYTPPRTSPFTDVPTNHPFYKEITWLATTGVSNGWTEADGTRTYRPLQSVNRDAMAAFMYRYASRFQ